MKSEIEILEYKSKQYETKIIQMQRELAQLQLEKTNVDNEIEKLKQIKEKYDLRSL